MKSAPDRTIASAFDAVALNYDAGRRRLVPCFDAFYSAALALVPQAAAHGSVVDLGAGTGLFAALVKQRFPDCRLTLIDLAEAMLEQAHQRFAASGHEADLVVGDYATADLGSDRTAVISALSIHHLEDEAKKALFAGILAALTPGGVFVNAEQVLGPTPALEQAYAAQWLADVRAAGSGEAEIAGALERMTHDRCAPLDMQLQWLRDAGFVDVDCWFKQGRFAVYAGTKPF